MKIILAVELPTYIVLSTQTKAVTKGVHVYRAQSLERRDVTRYKLCYYLFSAKLASRAQADRVCLEPNT